MTAGTGTTLHLQRWTINSGSNVQSRGAVVIASGEHQWEASGEGNGPVDALYRAVDRALSEVLSGHPRLVAFDVRAISEGPDATGVATVTIAPPSSASGARSEGRYDGEARSSNIVGASVEAYIAAINRLLAEEHWAGATESAGNRRRTREADRSGRAELDREGGDIDMTDIFNR
jgi:2-isopropylmalate synthase